MPIPSNEAIGSLVASGIDAYGRGDYFESHEHFEHAWLRSGSPRSLELHALAQLAAAMHKRVASEKPRAARAILSRARAKLGALEGSEFAIDLELLRAGIDAWLGSSSDPAKPILRVSHGDPR